MDSLASAVHLDTTTLAPGEQFTAWQRAVVGFEVTRPDHLPEAPFRASVSGFPLGSMVLVLANLGDRLGLSGAASPAQPNNVTILLLRRGTLSGETDGIPFTLGSGQLMVFDWRRAARVELSPAQSMALILPRTAIPHQADLHGRILGSTPGRLLTGYLLLLARQAAEASAEELPTLGQASLPLVVTCLAASGAEQARGHPTSSPAIRSRVSHHVEAHLRDRALSPGTIAAATGISRSSLYRAFADSGGIARYIQARRLEAAHVALGETDQVRTVKSIAFDFGFSSVPLFNTAFRRRYGYNPSHARLGSLPRLHAALDLADSTPAHRLAALVASLGR